MALYRYVKTLPKKRFFIFPAHQEDLPADQRPKKSKASKFVSIAFISIGLFLILLVIYPFLNYNLNLRRWRQNSLASPVSDIAIAQAKGLVSPSVSNDAVYENKDELKIIEEIDYNLISNWFPVASSNKAQSSKITHYTLSIPELKVKRGVVKIGGTKLKDSLIQYPGTAMPGEYGNTVIFGHSVLPTFYNPKDYTAMFSLIPTLNKGDQIIIEYDGMRFVYLVEDYFEAKPEEIDVLQQRFDRQMLSLVTCVPPGTYLRRGIIRARLTGI